MLVKDLGMIYATENSKYKQRFGIYECPQCGKHSRKCTYDVKRAGDLCRSCANSTHRSTNSLLYRIWQGMKRRCFDKGNKGYKNYGGRGITVSIDFLDFFTYKDYVEGLCDAYKKNYTIDRIDNNGNYERGNLRWASKSTQMRNTRVLYSNNSSGYRGVSFCKSKNKYRVQIRNNGRKIHLGTFKTAIEGAKAYDRYVIANKLEHNINGVEDES